MIFTYGVTNAGKSYTIVGEDESPGILPNVLKYLLKMKEDLINLEKNTPKSIFSIGS